MSTLRRWQKNALMVVYSALNESPRGFSGSASATPRSLAVACKAANEIRRPAMLVLESVAAGDDRGEVEDKVQDLRAAMTRAASI